MARKKGVKDLPILTLSFGLVFSVVYLAQLLFQASLETDAGYQTAVMIKEAVGPSVVTVSWLLHSNHTHFLHNLSIFAITGWWVENRVANQEFVLGVAGLLGVGANVTAAILFQVPGAGISGITTGLVVMIALGSFEELLYAENLLAKPLLDFTVSVFFVLWSMGVIGSLPSGTAVAVHVFGGVFGGAWFVNQKIDH